MDDRQIQNPAYGLPGLFFNLSESAEKGENL